jgi:cell division protein FtsL
MSVRYVDNRRAAKRLSWVLLFSIGVAMTVSLYFVKTHAQTAKKEVTRLEKGVKNQTAAIKVLEAELAYLSGPERLARLAEQSLGLAPIAPEDTSKTQNINALFPLREVETPEGKLPDGGER